LLLRYSFLLSSQQWFGFDEKFPDFSGAVDRIFPDLLTGSGFLSVSAAASTSAARSPEKDSNISFVLFLSFCRKKRNEKKRQTFFSCCRHKFTRFAIYTKHVSRDTIKNNPIVVVRHRAT
jgi:hypothetical protein